MNQKPAFSISIPQLPLVPFILTCFVSFMFPAMNQALYSQGTKADILIPYFTPYNPTNDWPRWKQMGFIPFSGLIVAVTSVLCLEII